MEWLIFAYTLPPEPSGKRVAVWRKLRRLGAVYSNEGLWFMPRIGKSEDEIQRVAKDVQRDGGSAISFVASEMDEEQAERLRANFLRARASEYQDLERECNKLISHIEREIERENFQFREIEGLEEDLRKLEHWFGQIRSRDVLDSPERELVAGLLTECRGLTERFTALVYKESKPLSKRPGARNGAVNAPERPRVISTGED